MIVNVLKFAPMGRSPCLPWWPNTNFGVDEQGRHGDLPMGADLKAKMGVGARHASPWSG